MCKLYEIFNDENCHPYLYEKLEIKDNNTDYKSTNDIVSLMNETFHLNKLAVEQSYIFGFNYSMEPTGIMMVSSGNNKSSNMYRKNIGEFLLLSGSDQFIIFHNHPNGNLDSSADDLIAYKTIENLGDFLNIDIIDSIIISKKGFYSMDEEEAYYD